MGRGRDVIRKKLLFVVEAMGGGVFTYIVALANELVMHYDVYLAYSTREQTPGVYEDCFDERIHLIEVKHFCREIIPIEDFKAIGEVKNIARTVMPDIIHLHSSKAGVIGRVAFSGREIPLFYTPHGYSFLMEHYKPAKRKMFKAVEMLCAKRDCTTISCSYGEHLETLKITRRAAYVSNGVNTEELDKILEKAEMKEHPFTVFTLGRICHQKNPVLFNAIAEAMPDIHFLWIGDGEMKGELKAGNIEVTGWIDRAEALRRGMNADIFLLTSLWEGLPISLLEAMYMKKLCVVSDVIGNRDVIKNGENGFVCKDVESFKGAILNTDNNEELIACAYQNIRADYNIVAMAEGYAEIYERTLKASGG